MGTPSGLCGAADEHIKECYAVLKREDSGENEILEVQYDPAVMGAMVKIQDCCLIGTRKTEIGFPFRLMDRSAK